MVVLVKGFTCPACKGHRLGVNGTKRPAPGLVVRYLRCSVCGHKQVTEERIRRPRPDPTPADAGK